MKRLLAILALACFPTWAAINAVTQWEVRNGGNDTNGGGFAYGLGNKEHAGMADLTIDATNNKVVTSATHNFVAGDVGKYINVTAGAGWRIGWYRIASVAANAATLDWSPSAAGNANVGTGDFYYGIDYPSVNDGKNTATANISTTDAAVTNSATLTSVGADFTESIAGNVIYLTIGGGSCDSGSVTTQRRQVIAYVDEATVTLDATPSGSPNNCTNVTMNIGGAVASVGSAGSGHVAGNTVWVKYNATAFSSTSTTTNVTVGTITLANGTPAATTTLRGYETTRGDETANRPTLAWGVNAGSNYVVTTGTYNNVENIIIDGVRATYTATRGVSFGSHSTLYKVKIKSCNELAVFMASGNIIVECEITDISGTNGAIYGAITGGSISNSYIHDNLTYGVRILGASHYSISNTIFDTNKSTTSYNAISTNAGAGSTLYVVNSVIYNSGSHGITIDAPIGATFVNTVFESNGGYGVNVAAANPSLNFVNCAWYGNSTASYQNGNMLLWKTIGDINASASVFVDAANGDFALNSVSGAGALLRRAGAPSPFPGSTTYTYRDVGASQQKSNITKTSYAQ